MVAELQEFVVVLVLEHLPRRLLALKAVEFVPHDEHQLALFRDALDRGGVHQLVFPGHVLFAQELAYSDPPQDVPVVDHFLVERHEGAILLAPLGIFVDLQKVSFEYVLLRLLQRFGDFELSFLDDVHSVGNLALFVDERVLDAVQRFDVVRKLVQESSGQLLEHRQFLDEVHFVGHSFSVDFLQGLRELRLVDGDKVASFYHFDGSRPCSRMHEAMFTKAASWTQVCDVREKAVLVFWYVLDEEFAGLEYFPVFEVFIERSEQVQLS